LIAAAAQLNAGVTSYTSALDAVAASFADIDSAASELSAGANEALTGGSGLQAGLIVLDTNVSAVPDQVAAITSGFDALTDAPFQPRSWLDSRNYNTDSITFVWRTEPLKKEKEKTPEPETKKDSVLDRLLNLFR